MAQHQPQEVGTRQRACFPLLRLAVAVAEGDLAVVTREDVLLADHAAIQIAAQIHECLGAGANSLAIHDPLVGMMRGQRQSCLGDGIEQLGPKDPG